MIAEQRKAHKSKGRSPDFSIALLCIFKTAGHLLKNQMIIQLSKDFRRSSLIQNLLILADAWGIRGVILVGVKMPGGKTHLPLSVLLSIAEPAFANYPAGVLLLFHKPGAGIIDPDYNRSMKSASPIRD